MSGDEMPKIPADFPHVLCDRVKQLEGWLAECYRLTGADPDGNEDWRLADSRAVEEVRELREDCDRYGNERDRYKDAMLAALDALNVHAFGGLGNSSASIEANNILVEALSADQS